MEVSKKWILVYRNMFGREKMPYPHCKDKMKRVGHLEMQSDQMATCDSIMRWCGPFT